MKRKANKKRAGTCHAVEHEESLACLAPPRCEPKSRKDIFKLTTKPLDYTDKTLIYYGPHPCGNCGSLIVKLGHKLGHAEFDQPTKPIYPNTQWQPHICQRAETTMEHIARDMREGRFPTKSEPKKGQQ